MLHSVDEFCLSFINIRAFLCRFDNKPQRTVLTREAYRNVSKSKRPQFGIKTSPSIEIAKREALCCTCGLQSKRPQVKTP